MNNVSIDTEMLLRHLEIRRASRLGEYVQVDGVEFNLTHPDLDRTEWEPINTLCDLPGSPLEPFIAFPWTSDEELARMRKRIDPPRAHAGDHIFIWSVAAYAGPPLSLGKLDHPHHQERRIVRLGLIRKGEPPIEVPGPWLFAGVADALTPIALNDAEGVRSALISRFERMTGQEDLLDNVGDIPEADWLTRFKDQDYENG